MITDRATLIERYPKAKALLEHLDAMPLEGDMTYDDVIACMELTQIYERNYLEGFLKTHDLPAKAAMAFIDQYDVEKLPAVADIEEWAIPTKCEKFTLMEFQTALLLKGSGCSERLIAEFLQRNRETIRRYLSPVVKAVEESLQLSKEERDKAVLPVIKNIIGQLSGKTSAA